MIKGFNADTWFGLFAPAGTPPEIIARLNAELQKAPADPATAETIVKVVEIRFISRGWCHDRSKCDVGMGGNPRIHIFGRI